VALSMENYVYVPKDRPEPRRLYIITQGTAMYRGETLEEGKSWGAADVLLTGRPNAARNRAYATSYWHVQYIGPRVFDELRDQFPRAYLMCKLWTVLRAVTDYMLETYRQSKISPILLHRNELESKVNTRQLAVELTGETNAAGEPTYAVISKYVLFDGFEITKRELDNGVKWFHVVDLRAGERPDGPASGRLQIEGSGAPYKVVDAHGLKRPLMRSNTRRIDGDAQTTAAMLAA